MIMMMPSILVSSILILSATPLRIGGSDYFFKEADKFVKGAGKKRNPSDFIFLKFEGWDSNHP